MGARNARFVASPKSILCESDSGITLTRDCKLHFDGRTPLDNQSPVLEAEDVVRM